MPTMVPERFDVRFDGKDVLLFRLAANGTASLLAVTERDWVREVATEQRAVLPVDTARRLFAEAGVPAAAVRVGQEQSPA